MAFGFSSSGQEKSGLRWSAVVALRFVFFLHCLAAFFALYLLLLYYVGARDAFTDANMFWILSASAYTSLAILVSAVVYTIGFIVARLRRLALSFWFIPVFLVSCPLAVLSLVLVSGLRLLSSGLEFGP